jgi:hypothetical protein
MKIDSDGSVNIYGYLYSSSIVHSPALKTNTLSAYAINRIDVLNDIKMNNKDLTGSNYLDCSNTFTCYSPIDATKHATIDASSSYLTARGLWVRGKTSSTIIETNASGETCSIAMNGNFMQFINPIDNLGFIFTDEDTNPETSYLSYISSSGNLVVSSSSIKKHSIRKKEHKNYLERLNKLNIYTYAYKVPILNSDKEKTKTRKYFKNKQLHLGVLSDEVAEIFDNCTDNFKTIEFNKDNLKEIKESIKNYTPKVDEQEYINLKNKNRGDVVGVKYDSLLCYTILAVQELSKKVELLEK